MTKTSKDPEAWLNKMPLFVSGAGPGWSGRGRQPEWLRTSSEPLIDYLNPRHKDFAKTKARLEKHAQSSSQDVLPQPRRKAHESKASRC